MEIATIDLLYCEFSVVGRLSWSCCCMNVSSKVIASCFALSAFIIAILAGAAADNPAGQIILRALIAMAVCYPVGVIVGVICARVIALHVEQFATKEAVANSAAANDAPKQKQEPEDVIVV
jgi:hypothetical protein